MARGGLKVLGVAAVVAVLLAGCSSSAPSGANPDSGEDAALELPEETPVLGSLASPVAFGTVVDAGSWKITITGSSTDALAGLYAESPGLFFAPDGTRLLLATASYENIDDKHRMAMPSVGFMDASGSDAYGTRASEYDACRNNLSVDDAVGDPGTTEPVRICNTVPIDKIQGGAWVVQDMSGPIAFFPIE